MLGAARRFLERHGLSPMPRHAWLEVHRPVKEYAAATQASQETGHTVGEIARGTRSIASSAAKEYLQGRLLCFSQPAPARLIPPR